MSHRLLIVALVVILLSALVPPAAAQGGEAVELEASDGLVLLGLYYAPPEAADTGAPAVLLMHHGNSRKEAWIDFIPVLQEAGYGVLTVDIRGHGETRGRMDPALAEEDALAWLEWLREQPGVDPDRLSIVGASLGADLGLRVMARDERLVTLVGLSVLLDAMDINTLEAVETMGARPFFLVAGREAAGGAERDALLTLVAAAEGEVQARLYDSTACCTFLIMLEEDLAPSIITWLDNYNR